MMKAKTDMDFGKIYVEWLKQNIDQFRVNETTSRMTLPFLDRNNDHIEMYIINNGNETYTITDDGELTVNCTDGDLPLKKHMLAQCMIKVSDMFYLSRSNIQAVFLEDVQKFFDLHDVRYIDNICLTGKSKLTTHYDFAIARSHKSAERFIKVVNNMDLNAARNIIFAWNDTRDMRQHEAKLYAFIQNSDKKVSDDAIGALKEYGIKPALWTEKDKYISELTA